MMSMGRNTKAHQETKKAQDKQGPEVTRKLARTSLEQTKKQKGMRVVESSPEDSGEARSHGYARKRSDTPSSAPAVVERPRQTVIRVALLQRSTVCRRLYPPNTNMGPLPAADPGTQHQHHQQHQIGRWSRLLTGEPSSTTTSTTPAPRRGVEEGPTLDLHTERAAHRASTRSRSRMHTPTPTQHPEETGRRDLRQTFAPSGLLTGPAPDPDPGTQHHQQIQHPGNSIPTQDTARIRLPEDPRRVF
ncbi:hypothetical protein DPEC_G00343030 [Dallia pectoralis]|uniref:Uncharacterized protein n=1 Tax=Dallia pectoralis TaxID=75939 RepID=A0ACC2F2S0_DALPE|nr:hypothetical protein DPEC_G00343030 [Dallia pectoralis]